MAADSDFRNVIVRLEEFHLLMSFLGSIGFIMAGSGIKELLNVIYASISVDKILTGHVYGRAIRAHLLAQLALAKVILRDVDFSIAERGTVRNIMHDFIKDPPTLSTITDEPVVQEICEKFKQQLLQVQRKVLLQNCGSNTSIW